MTTSNLVNAGDCPLLELIHVSKHYGIPNDDKANLVLRDVSLRLCAGESIVVTGPSGSGKSTLLNIMGTLDRPTSGSVVFEGRDVSQLNEDALAAIRRCSIGFVFQLHHLLPQCTALENVLLATLALQRNRTREEDTKRALHLLERVGLAARLHHFPGQLSGGERQRVAVVRALINSPKLLLADEPTGSLDRAAASNLTHLLLELNEEEGVALVVVTHSQDVAAHFTTQFELANGTLK